MNEHKILLFILSVIVYCLYSVQMWLATSKVSDVTPEIKIEIPNEVIINNSEPEKKEVKPKQRKFIPLVIKDACSALQVFTEKPETKNKKPKHKDMDSENSTITSIGITAFLIILTLNAIVDVVKVKEEERARRKLNPNGERRQSLAEFANKKPLRRESSKFGLQLFQIAESDGNGASEEKKSRKETRTYTRGESINSYLTDKKIQPESSAPASVAEIPTERKLVKRQSVAKLFGARPVPMVRRSSFPALPLNPDIHAIMMNHRQPSVDSDDESDGKGRRVRIIRRF